MNRAAPRIAERVITALDPSRVNIPAARQAIIDGLAQGLSPLRALHDLGAVSWEEIERAVWSHAGYEFVEIDPAAIDLTLAEKWPVTQARQHRVLPLEVNGQTATIAVIDPDSFTGLDLLRGRLGVSEVIIKITDPASLDAGIRTIEQAGFSKSSLRFDEDDEDEGVAIASSAQLASQGQYGVAIDNIIKKAATQRASDIHIEPNENEVRIRFRIDGVLKVIETHPARAASPLVNTVKNLAGMDVGERRRPLAGRIGIEVNERRLDLRIATIPIDNAERETVVIRLLDPNKSIRNLGELGFDQTSGATFEKLIRRPHGAVILTGPTGSGKSSTLYASLQMVADDRVKVCTVEDPIEYTMAGVTQVAVNEKIGFTFAAALRTFLRMDPDIILVGEVRDADTSKTAIEAAMTGHLLLTTLHTNTAAGAFSRLVELGVERFLVGSAIAGVVNQRLARRLCKSCRIKYKPEDAELLKTGQFEWPVDVPMPDVLYRAKATGCSRCSNTGYHDRVCLVEILEMNDKIRTAMSQRATDQDIEDIAVECGMVPLRVDGVRKAAAGITSIEELIRVCF